MDKKEISILLEEKHRQLFDWLQIQSKDRWLFAPENKWTVGQHILHLVNSIKLLNKALNYPKFIIKYKFGTNNRENRNYVYIVSNYQNKLIQNQDKAKAFNKSLKIPTASEKENLLTQLQIQNKKLQYKTNKISDKNLDTLLIPHPLMGRMTIREIIMWTAYHTQHHTEILKEKY